MEHAYETIQYFHNDCLPVRLRSRGAAEDGGGGGGRAGKRTTSLTESTWRGVSGEISSYSSSGRKMKQWSSPIMITNFAPSYYSYLFLQSEMFNLWLRAKKILSELLSCHAGWMLTTF